MRKPGERVLVPEERSDAKYIHCAQGCFKLSVMYFTLMLLGLSSVPPVVDAGFAVMT